MRKLFILLMLFIAIGVKGQYQLKGIIKDYQDETALLGCSVLLFSASDTSYKNKVTAFKDNAYTYLNEAESASNGTFLIDSITTKKCNVLISLLGHERLLIKNITFKKTDTIDLGAIYLFRVSLVAGFDEHYPGDLEEIRKANKTKFSINYPKHAGKLKMKIEDEIVTISYKQLLKKAL